MAYVTTGTAAAAPGTPEDKPRDPLFGTLLLMAAGGAVVLGFQLAGDHAAWKRQQGHR